MTPIRREGEHSFVVELDGGAADLLTHMCDELEALLQTDSPLLTRLFPPPYGDDAERNAGYAALATPELIEHRQAALAAVRTVLDADRVTEEQFMAWMRALNDMRLVLGTLLGITEDTGPAEVPDDLADTMAVYEFLGFLLEMTVEALAS